MAKKTEKTKSKKAPAMLEGVEYDMVWMAYRYAIGRNTIAANAFGRDLPKYVLGKLSDERLEFMAFDIRREIENRLRWSSPSLYIEDPSVTNQRSGLYDPIGLYIMALRENNIKSIEELQRFKKFVVEDVHLNIKAVKATESQEYILSSPLEGLLVWDTVAKIFDKHSHYLVDLKKDDHEENNVECIKVWQLKDYKTLEYEEVLCPIDRWVANSYILTTCAKEYITDIRRATI